MIESDSLSSNSSCLSYGESGHSSSSSGGSGSLSNRNLNLSGSGHSSSGSRERKNSIYENTEVDVIDDEDLADVDDDISLGNSVESGTGVVRVRIGGKEEEYIDDPIVEDIMGSADERLTKKTTFPAMRVAVCVIGVTLLLSIIIGASLNVKKIVEKKRIEGIIEDRTSAFEFDDRDEYVESIVDETAEVETIDAEWGENDTTFWENEIPLGNEDMFPLAIENYLADPRLQHFDSRYETPLFFSGAFCRGDLPELYDSLFQEGSGKQP